VKREENWRNSEKFRDCISLEFRSLKKDHRYTGTLFIIIGKGK
jgi:hypothetical protein